MPEKSEPDESTRLALILPSITYITITYITITYIKRQNPLYPWALNHEPYGETGDVARSWLA